MDYDANLSKLKETVAAQKQEIVDLMAQVKRTKINNKRTSLAHLKNLTFTLRVLFSSTTDLYLILMPSSSVAAASSIISFTRSSFAVDSSFLKIDGKISLTLDTV